LIRYNPEQAREYREKLIEEVQADVAECYQCGNCSAGCPANFTFDYPPNQMMRMLQVGLVDELLRSKSVQNCIQCLTCSARCPRTIDVAGIIEDLKTIAAARGIAVPEHVETFNHAFLKNIARFGQLNEALFLVRFNLESGQPFNDASLGTPMLTRGKLDPIPRRAAGAGEVGRIYEKAMEKARWQA